MAPTRSYYREERVRTADADPFGRPATEPWRASGPDLYRVGVEPGRAAHRRPRAKRGRRRARTSGRATTILMTMTAAAVAVGGTYALNGGIPTDRPSAAVEAAIAARSSITEPASRGEVRAVPVSPAPSVPPAPSAPSAAPPAPKASASTRRSTAPRTVEPVAGLTRAQMNNAATVVTAGRERDLPRRAMLVAVMTAFQESDLRNLANPTVPASLNRSHEGEGADFDSLGLFQQRPSQGWGTVAQLMDPRYAAGAFYDKLTEIDGWEDRSLAGAAQAVQRSRFPGAYAKHEDRAIEVVDALL